MALEERYPVQFLIAIDSESRKRKAKFLKPNVCFTMQPSQSRVSCVAAACYVVAAQHAKQACLERSVPA